MDVVTEPRDPPSFIPLDLSVQRQHDSILSRCCYNITPNRLAMKVSEAHMDKDTSMPDTLNNHRV